MTNLDPLVQIGLVTFIGTVVSVIISVIVAAIGVRGAVPQAADDISTGASVLLREYKELREGDKLTISTLSERLDELENWQNEMEHFIIPLLEGAHRLKHQVIALDADPVYDPPRRPDWLRNIKHSSLKGEIK